MPLRGPLPSPAGSGLSFPCCLTTPSPRSSPGPAVRNLRVTLRTPEVSGQLGACAFRRERPTGDGEQRRGAGAETWKGELRWVPRTGPGAEGSVRGRGPGARGRSLREAKGTCPGGRGRGGTQVKPHLALTLQPALLEPRRHVAHVCPLQGFLGHVQRAFRPVEVDQLLHEVQGVRALQPPPRDAATIHPLVPQFVAEALQLLLAQVFQCAQEQLAGSGSAGLHAGGGRTRSAGCCAPVTPASRRRVRPQPRAPTSTRGFDAPPSIQVAPGQRLKERSTGSVVLSSQDRDRGLSSKAFQGFHASDRIAVWWRNGVTPRRALAAADPSVRGRLPTPHPAFCSSFLGIHVKCPE